jgi:hypothetical protein
VLKIHPNSPCVIQIHPNSPHVKKLIQIHHVLKKTHPNYSSGVKIHPKFHHVLFVAYCLLLGFRWLVLSFFLIQG